MNFLFSRASWDGKDFQIIEIFGRKLADIALFFQQFLYSALNGKLHEGQPFRAQVVSAVPFESKIQEPAQMVPVFVGHDLLGFPYEIIIHAWHLGFGILQNVFLAFQGFGTCQIQ